MTPFFSIIIPVYNVAPYLRECLDSVLAQTFADWEAICVDDGSTDGSGAILGEYAARDKRFRVIHQKNAGVSAARNAAMELMNGDWFLFVDADDEIREDALQIFSKYLSNKIIDGILIYPYTSSWDGGEIPIRKIETKVLVDNASKEDLFLGPYAANGLAISRIYRRSTFSALRFKVGMSMCEDVCFWFDALAIDAKWIILQSDYYLYRQRATSACGVWNPHNIIQVLDGHIYALQSIGSRINSPTANKKRYSKRFKWGPLHYLSKACDGSCEIAEDEWELINERFAVIEQECGQFPFPLRYKVVLLLSRTKCGRFVLPVYWYVITNSLKGKHLLATVLRRMKVLNA